MKYQYDLAIIGGGAVGLIAAPFALRLGAKVAFIEKDRIGGDCTWTGCVPSKTLIKSASVVYQMRTAARFGLVPVDIGVDLKLVMEHVHSVIADIYGPTRPEALRDQGIEVFLGAPRFLDAHTIAVGAQKLTANYVLVCTGASPFVPPIPGLDQTGYLTYRTLWDLRVLPQHLAVLGGGPIGCEIAQAFHRLGSKVTLVEGGDRLLARDDHDASRTLAAVFAAEGIELKLNSKVERAWREGNRVHLAGGQETICDALLVAVGRHPNVEGLDLDKAGIAYTKQGIKVDKNLRTTQSHIYAAGDCLGGLQFSHYAGWQGFVAVRNALLPFSSKGLSDHVPWTTFTDPEIAHVGLTEELAREKFGKDVDIETWPMKKVDRALNETESVGFLKLIYRKNRQLLGVTIVAAKAGEMINEWVVAMDRGLKADQLAGPIHVYPSYGAANEQVSAAVLVKRLNSGLAGAILKRFARVAHK